MKFDKTTGLPRWELEHGQYVLADSSIEGGGVRIIGVGGRVVARGMRAVAAVIGADHPAVEESLAATQVAREVQAAAARVERQLHRDARR